MSDINVGLKCQMEISDRNVRLNNQTEMLNVNVRYNIDARYKGRIEMLKSQGGDVLFSMDGTCRIWMKLGGN